jgi:Protein of unknown function (DUF3352)
MHHEPDSAPGEETPERPTEQPDASEHPTVEVPSPTEQFPTVIGQRSPYSGSDSGEHVAPPPEHVPTPTEQFPPAADHGYVTPPPPLTPGGGSGDGPQGPGGPYVTAPQGPGGPYGPAPRRRRGKVVAAVVAGVLLVGGVAFAGVMLVTKQSAAPDALAKMVPARDQVYATAYLDPGADQKLNLRNVLGRFPALKGTDPAQKLDEGLEQALKPSGLSFVEDVKPWLGTQIAVAGRMDDSGKPDADIMIASKDDQKALDTMKRLERLSSNAEFKWRDESYKDVSIRVGTAPQSSFGGDATPFGNELAYGIVDHSLVLASSFDRMQEVIDADQGSGDALADDDNFTKARDALPDHVLGMAYLNLGDLIDKTIPQLEAGLGFASLPNGCGADQLNKSLDALRAFRGLAFSLTAETNGVALDAGIVIDRSKLPSGAATIVQPDAHQNVALSYTPENAFGLLALNGASGLDAGLGQLSKCDPNVNRQIEHLGVKDVLAQLSGDLGVEVDQGSGGGVPSGALIASVKDEGAMKAALDKLVSNLGQLGSSGPVPKPTSQTYQGVTIESLQLDPSNTDVVPSWAVTDGVAIIATTPDEVKAAIDAHKGNDITDSSTFQQAAAAVDLDSTAMAYVDVGKVLDAVQANLSGFDLASFKKEVENVRPVKASIVASTSDGDVVGFRWFFLVP